jgi:fermentation-respiration switch protein FrsA (DUF1100 family)
VELFRKNDGDGSGYGRRIALSMLRIATGVVVVSIVLIMTFEDKLIYFPAKYPEGLWGVETVKTREGEVGPKIEDAYFKTGDGVTLHGWFCSPQENLAGVMRPVASEMVLLWFHGNAGNLSHRLDMIQKLVRLPVTVFIVDYRGYGRSEGTPSELGLYADGRAAWEYLVNGRGIPPDRIVIFGKSLGGVVAIDLATRVEAGGLIVQSSFTSAADMASRVMPLLPQFLIRTKFDSIGKIGRVGCPKLFIHSRADEVVPYELGRRLYLAASEPKRFYDVDGAPHNETYIIGGEAYLAAINGFIQSCAGR